MAIVIINKEAFYILKRPFQGKYIFYTSDLFFILLAFIYLDTSQIKYKVSSEIILNNSFQSAELVAEDLQSKILVQKAISKLPFEVNYYKESSPQKEIYGDSLPVKLILNRHERITYTNDLIIKSLSSHSFSIEHQDTIQFYEINERVNRYYGKFRVVRGPAFTPHFQTVIVRLNEPVDMLEYYYNNLIIEPDESNKTVALSILVNNAQKGQDFLYKLLEFYSKSNNIHALNKKTNYSDSINALTQKLELLQAGTKQSSALNGPKLSPQQLKTLEIIKTYLQEPLNQFEQVPYTEEVQSGGLRDDLDGYNKMQFEVQRLLVQTKIDDLEVSNIDKQISILKASILSSIYRLQNDKVAPNTQPDKAAERHLRAEILKYQRAQNAAIINSGNIRIIEKPEDNIEEIAPNAFLVYGLALLLGLLIPRLFALINNQNASIVHWQWFNRQPFGDKLKIFFGVRQID